MTVGADGDCVGPGEAVSADTARQSVPEFRCIPGVSAPVAELRANTTTALLTRRRLHVVAVQADGDCGDPVEAVSADTARRTGSRVAMHPPA